MSTAELSAYNVVASFRDRELAQDAIVALESAGFAEDDLSLLGRPVEEVDMGSEKGPGEPIGGGVGKHVASGGASGGVAGGVLGALATAAVAAIPGVGMVAGTGALIGAIAGAGAGSTVGAIIEGESALRSDHTWTQAFDAIKEGAVVVGVHSGDAARIAAARRVLEEQNPMEVHQVNSSGEEVREA